MSLTISPVAAWALVTADPPGPEDSATSAVWYRRHWVPQVPSPAVLSTLAGAASTRPLALPDALLLRLRELAPGDPARVAIRARVIEWYLPMTVYLARRFLGRGESQADLTQVAVVGLIKAVDRFDIGHGVPFPGYATPTILGELKRHFRDNAWSIRVPRRLQEMKLQVTIVAEELGHAWHRSPTAVELAAQLGVSRDEVLDAQRCANAYRPLSFEAAAPGGEGLRLVDSLGGPDPRIEAVDARETLRLGLAHLPARERRVVNLRYFEDMTQTQIAAEIGVSQMQVSRLLNRSLARLRDAMLGPGATGSAGVRQRPTSTAQL